MKLFLALLLSAICVASAYAQSDEKQILYDFRSENYPAAGDISPAVKKKVLDALFPKYFTDEKQCSSATNVPANLEEKRKLGLMDPSVNANPLLRRMKTVADQEAAKLGYDINNMGVDLDTENSKWKKYSGAQASLSKTVSEIESKDYIAVYYYPIPLPRHATMGGDLWVFVDPSSAKIITVLRGQ